MNLIKLLKLALLSYCLLAVSTLYSQQAEDEEESEEATDDEIVDLSPFVIRGDEDIGYRATSTLAGTKIKTDVRDLSASLAIVTEELMTDLNATELADVLVYTGNTEVSGLLGNFSGSQGFGAGVVIGELARDQNSGGVTRVRGLAEADLTRDYFLTWIPFDSYNTDRVTIQRGANAVLFGLGSPGGIVNNNLVKAQYNDKGHLKYRTDEFGSQRVELRYNKMILEDKLAVSVSMLYDNEEFEQEEAHSLDKRLYINALYEPIKSWKFRASFEIGDIFSAKPRAMPPADLISVWFDVGRPILNDPLEAGIWRSGTTNLQGVEQSNALLSQIVGGTAGPTVMWMDPNSGTPLNPSHRTFLPAADVDDSNPFGNVNRHMVGLRPSNVIRRLLGINPDGTPVTPGSGGFFDQNTGQQITDRSIFDYRKHLLDGGLSTQYARFNETIFSVEKTFFKDRLGFEVAFKDETFDEGQLNQLRGDPTGEALILDFNNFLGVSDPTLGEDVIPNPNFGGIAVASRAENGISFRRRESLRITGFTEIRASDFLNEDKFITKLLGRITGTAVYQERDSDFYQLFSRDTPTINDVLQTTVNGNASELNVNAFRVGQYHALAVPGLPAGTNLTELSSFDDLRGANIQPINSAQRLPSSQNFVLWNLAQNAFEERMLGLNTILDGNGVPATFFSSKTRDSVDSIVVNGIYYFWNDFVALQGAWRRDEQESFSVGAPSLPAFTRRENLNDPNFFVADEATPNLVFENEIRTWGIVVHTPQWIQERLPWGLDFDFHYGEAENFEPTSGRVDVLNRAIPAVSGDTEEMGFTVAMFDQKIIAKVNWYETGILNRSFDNGAFSAPEGIMINLATQLDNADNVAQGFTVADVQAHLPSQDVIDLHGIVFDFVDVNNTTSSPNPSRQGSQDFVSEGVEVEIIFNPIRNWTSILNITRTETVTANTAPVLQQWFNDFVKPVWIDSSFAQNYFINDDSSETLAQAAQSRIGDVLTRSVSQDGSPAIEQSEWHINVTSKYTFENLFQNWEWIDNFALGSSIRYSSKRGIGFPVTTNQFGETVLDISNPFFGPSQTFVDLFTSWDTPIFGHKTTFQLHVRDVSDHDDLVPVFANPDGSQTFRINEGRVFSFSATVHF